MFKKPSLIMRIIVGQIIGFIFGLLGFILLSYFLPETSILLRWGILLWYITLGSIIGVFGVFTYHPILKFPLPWWFRDPIIGLWMNFVLAFLAYDSIEAVLISFFGENGLISCPFWITLEGALVGLIIGFFATYFGGEGTETVK